MSEPPSFASNFILTWPKGKYINLSFHIKKDERDWNRARMREETTQDVDQSTPAISVIIKYVSGQS